MAVRIRLTRRGSKKRPFYWIVAAFSESPRDGRFIEKIGTYNPLVDPEQIDLKSERLQYWLGQGAQLTDTVNSLLRKHGGAQEAKAS